MRRSRKTISPTSPTPKPSTKTEEASTFSLVILALSNVSSATSPLSKRRVLAFGMPQAKPFSRLPALAWAAVRSGPPRPAPPGSAARGASGQSGRLTTTRPPARTSSGSRGRRRHVLTYSTGNNTWRSTGNIRRKWKTRSTERFRWPPHPARR